MDWWYEECAKYDAKNGVEPRRLSTHVMEVPDLPFFGLQAPRGSTGSDGLDVSATFPGDSWYPEDGSQQCARDVWEGLLNEPCCGSDFEMDDGSGCASMADEEEVPKIGEGIWVHEEYLAYLRKPQEMDILLFLLGKPGDDEWMASAPEWPNALGFGGSIKEASADLQSKLAATKQLIIDDKDVRNIKVIPLDPCRKDAVMACREWLKSYYDGIVEDSRYVLWNKIWV